MSKRNILSHPRVHLPSTRTASRRRTQPSRQGSSRRWWLRAADVITKGDKGQFGDSIPCGTMRLWYTQYTEHNGAVGGISQRPQCRPSPARRSGSPNLQGPDAIYRVSYSDSLPAGEARPMIRPGVPISPVGSRTPPPNIILSTVCRTHGRTVTCATCATSDG